MRAVFLMVCLAITGCDETQTQTQTTKCGDGDAIVDAGEFPIVYEGDAGEVCGPNDIVVTTLPAVSVGDLLMMCTHCDVGLCDGLGDPCPSYGSSCAFNGVDSVCVGCCNGETGELHCKKP